MYETGTRSKAPNKLKELSHKYLTSDKHILYLVLILSIVGFIILCKFLFIISKHYELASDNISINDTGEMNLLH